MSLATRCTSCSTVFRVVQDQLRVSSGWVRCGRCGEVFNAIESLVDLDVERPDGPASVHGSRVMEDLARFSGVANESRPDLDGDTTATPSAEDVVPGASVRGTDTERAPSLASGPRPGDLPEITQAGEPSPEGVSAAHGVQIADVAAGSSVAAATFDPGESPDTPGFVRQADRAARWRRPGVRALLSLGILVAAGGLGWQMLWSHHDWIATRWPVTRPGVEAFCARLDCRLGPPRVLDALAVDSSGLTRAPGISGYRLVVAIRNRSDLRVRVPALDLALTDTAGAIIARRVVALDELGESTDSIGPGIELSVSGLLRVDGAAVSGYTVEIFYP